MPGRRVGRATIPLAMKPPMHRALRSRLLAARKQKLMEDQGGNLSAIIAHHDAEIVNLGSRMSGMEEGLKGLSREVGTGFTAINSKLDRLDSMPKFNFRETLQTVSIVALLFGVVVSGILWLVNAQSSAFVQEQRTFNSVLSTRTDHLTERVDRNLELISGMISTGQVEIRPKGKAKSKLP